MVEGATAQAPEGAAGEEPLPRQFGKYTLLRRLAAGGMAELYLALHRSVASFEKLVVIKRILPSMNQDRAFIEMLLHEARIAATLSHPNIVQIFDVGQHDGCYFIAMEHIHGEDVRSIVRAMRRKSVAEFPLEHALTICLGMCAGLAYAHEKRDLEGGVLDIVHRDISPQNVVVTFTGDVKIVDFGVAKSVQAGDEAEDGKLLKGKAPYMSPEQARGDAIDWRSDIFAVGVVLFELTTGRRLFKGSSEYETLHMITERDYPRPVELKPGYPPALDAIVMKALAKRREDRYQSAREMQGELEAFIREERVAASQVGLSSWMRFLFEEKLDQQKAVLQDIKQLADVLSAEHPTPDEEQMGSGAGMIAGSGVSPAPAPRRSSTGIAIAAVSVLAVVAASVLYLRAGQPTRGDADPGRAPGGTGQRDAPGDVAQAAPAPTRGSLEITTDPPGCSIWISGDLQQEVTPTRIDNLPLGRELELKLTREGLEPHREKIVLTATEASRTITRKMALGSVTIALKVTPRAAVWVDGVPWKGDPDRIEGITAGEEHKIVLAADGYVPKTLTINARPGETRSIEERLFKLPPGAR
ncbi:serine/threonine protein kinase [Chondromyces apiculatus]|uniref:Serine/threonine protein kinase PrkC, regulator of stationary phase n=1 Tax=Chondromyces apiculatus DSM 436 TaxID=1192034 RepID=A0A017SWY7_9BACT|nr:serine/threonine-protein kinase [Chondromyces apiculatus]EYF01287.1 Serine/threonine protein kinase PrkC, regulator of stationary phase [Chondromyces apiculatus DSM 436]